MVLGLPQPPRFQIIVQPQQAELFKTNIPHIPGSFQPLPVALQQRVQHIHREQQHKGALQQQQQRDQLNREQQHKGALQQQQQRDQLNREQQQQRDQLNREQQQQRELRQREQQLREQSQKFQDEYNRLLQESGRVRKPVSFQSQ